MSDEQRLQRVEVTTQYATTVPSLQAAWAFVMDHVDAVGPDPRIEIKPQWYIGFDWIEARWFSVVVDGMVAQEPGDA